MASSKDNTSNHGHAAFGLLRFVVISEFTGKEGDRAAVLQEHLTYQESLEEKGVLFAAGPLLKEDMEMAGIGLIVYRADSLEEAKKLADGDPFHKTGLRDYKIYPWRVNEGSLDLKIRYASGHFELE
jgi:uncharacterized protein YciI